MANPLQSTDTDDTRLDFADSPFSQKYQITDIHSNVTAWNRDWEEIVRKLTAQEAFSILKEFWEQEVPNDVLTKLKIHVLKLQKAIAEMWEIIEERGHLDTLWLLLPEKYRKRCLLKAMEESLRETSLNHEARALCPEISIRSMWKGNVTAWITFIEDFIQHIAGQTQIYYPPSEWWNQAAHEPANEPEPGHIFACLTVQRAEFISAFCSAICYFVTLVLTPSTLKVYSSGCQ